MCIREKAVRRCYAAKVAHASRLLITASHLGRPVDAYVRSASPACDETGHEAGRESGRIRNGSLVFLS